MSSNVIREVLGLLIQLPRVGVGPESAARLQRKGGGLLQAIPGVM